MNTFYCSPFSLPKFLLYHFLWLKNLFSLWKILYLSVEWFEMYMKEIGCRRCILYLTHQEQFKKSAMLLRNHNNVRRKSRCAWRIMKWSLFYTCHIRRVCICESLLMNNAIAWKSERHSPWEDFRHFAQLSVSNYSLHCQR